MYAVLIRHIQQLPWICFNWLIKSLIMHRAMVQRFDHILNNIQQLLLINFDRLYTVVIYGSYLLLSTVSLFH